MSKPIPIILDTDIGTEIPIGTGIRMYDNPTGSDLG